MKYTWWKSWVTGGLDVTGRGRGGGSLLHFQKEGWLTCIISVIGQTPFTLLLWAFSSRGIGAKSIPDVYYLGGSGYLGVFKHYTEEQWGWMVWVMGMGARPQGCLITSPWLGEVVVVVRGLQERDYLWVQSIHGASSLLCVGNNGYVLN